MTKIVLPPYYVIEPTDICNFRCSICPHSQDWNDKQRGMMDMSLFVNIISQISDMANVIQLYWMGEPLLNPNLFNMIAICKQYTNAKIIISTNGSLLTKDAVSHLVDSGLDELVVSADACNNQQIYNQIRTGGDIAKLNTNIEYLLKNKGQMNIVLQFIDMYINKTEKENFIRKWKHFDCDIEISCLFTWSNQLPWLNDASDNLSPVRVRNRVPCADLWKKMVIHWNGDVSACCFDYDNRLPLGNCNTTALTDIWNGLEARKLRAEHLRGIYDNRLCAQCDAWAEPDEYQEMYHL